MAISMVSVSDPNGTFKETTSQFFNNKGGHKPRKPGKLREFEKLLKSLGKVGEIFYFWR